jgi:iron complex outermembrane receptor protein
LEAHRCDVKLAIVRVTSLRVSFLAGAFCTAVSALGQEQPVPSPTLLPEVTVTATRVEEDSFRLPVSIDRVVRRAISEDKAQVNLSESLNGVPGVVVQNRQNYAQDLQVSSRGFGARATFGVRGVRLIADGIPATMPDGQGQTATFDLGSAERIEVLRGPFSVLYGNAAGGVIQVFTEDGPAEPTLSSSVYAGSFDTYKLGVKFGGTSGRLNYLGNVSRFQTDGYREHSGARRDHLNAKAKFAAGAHGLVTLVVNALDQPETQDPLGLTATQVAQDPRQAGSGALAFNTRKSVSQNQLGLTYNLAFGRDDRIEARIYYGDRQVTQFLAIPLFAQNAPTASGGVVDLDRGYGGAGLRWTRATELLGMPLTGSIGIDYDRMDERRQGFVNDFGVAGALKRNEDNVVARTDPYAQVEWRPTPRTTLLAGVRYSRVRFDSTDYFFAPSNGNGNDSGSVTYTDSTAAAGITFGVTQDTNLYANIGTGFETPTFAELAYRPGSVSGLNFALQPARSRQWEAGLKAKFANTMRLNLALFRIDVCDEIVVDRSSGGRTVFKNAAKTRREGLELAWNGRFANGFEAALAYTWLNARFEQPFTSGTPLSIVPVGNRIPGVPPQRLFGKLIWRHAPAGFHVGAEVLHNGKVYADEANSEFAPAYTVWNLHAGFEQRGRNWRLNEFVRLDNVGDRQTIGAVIVNQANGRYYEPAPGRNWLVGFTASLGF